MRYDIQANIFILGGEPRYSGPVLFQLLITIYVCFLLTPTSRDTTSIAALSGGNSRATIRSLYLCPYRATCCVRAPEGSDPF
jgi:hypothetical protein